MFAKGPTPGYGAAKAEALALDPSLRCRRHVAMGISGWVVWRGDKALTSGALARHAWAKVPARLAALKATNPRLEGLGAGSDSERQASCPASDSVKLEGEA